jgi:hypothetical protein
MIGEKQSDPAFEKPSLFASLKSAFPPKVEANPQSKSMDSGNGSDAPSSEKLPAETEAQLSKVPDVIGDDAGKGSGEAELTSDDVRSLIESVGDFEEEDVKAVLEETFDWLSEYFGSTHWKLTERQMRIMGRPTTRMVNALWEKLKEILPDILGKWLQSVPGAAAFLMAAGIVVVPKVKRQYTLSQQARKQHVPIQDVADRLADKISKNSEAAAAVIRNQPGAFVPEATGVIGGM